MQEVDKVFIVNGGSSKRGLPYADYEVYADGEDALMAMEKLFVDAIRKGYNIRHTVKITHNGMNNGIITYTYRNTDGFNCGYTAQVIQRPIKF